MKSQTKHILSAAVLLASVLFGSLTNTYAAGEQEQYHIIYHDQNGSVIKRVPFTQNYQFDENMPPFFVELPYKNVAWNTKADGSGTSYTKESTPVKSLCEDLDVYPQLAMGHFVRFDSQGGTPIEYQFVLSGEKAVKPVNPTRTGYIFDKWCTDKACTANYDFGLEVKDDMMLYAKWTPKTDIKYTVKIWLEKATHPNRSSLDDAIAHAEDDYSYADFYEKQGKVDEYVSFEESEIISGKIKQNTYVFKADGVEFPVYFYDNEDNSYAQSMSEKSREGVKISADGNTTINIYLRRLYFNFTINNNFYYSTKGDYHTVSKDRSGNIVEDGPLYQIECPMRFSEPIVKAIERSGKNIEPDVFLYMVSEIDYRIDIDLMNWMNVLDDSGTQIWGMATEAANILSLALPNPSAMYDDNKVIVHDKDKASFNIYKATKGKTLYVRHRYLQTLESAKLNNETDINNSHLSNYTLKEEQLFLRSEFTKDGLCNGFSINAPSGFELYFYQMANRDNPNNIKYADLTAIINGSERYYMQGDHFNKDKVTGAFAYINGSPQQYTQISKYLPYENISTKPEWNNIHYRLEFFSLRNSYILSFNTFTEKCVVKSNEKFNKVFYEEPLKDYSAYVVTEGGDLFEVDKTTYTDDQLVRWVFKGWYDNELFLGDPIDFATTTRKMPASNLTLYAKWEPKTIKAEYDGNGGKVEGQDKIEKEQPSGKIPVRPEDPVPPEGMYFFGWTINGKYYDFQDPISDDTKLVAVYYAKGDSYDVIYKAGSGTGSAPEDSNKYLYDANAEVLAPTDALVPPVGQKFLNWTDEEGRSYTPGQDVIIKGDVTLKAAFSGLNAGIIIRRKGLIANDKVTESATYQIFKDGAAVPMMVVSLTGKDASGSVVSTSISRLALGTYTVKESSWTWAYDIGETKVIDGDTTVTSDTPGTGTGELKEDHTLIFDFTGEHKEEVSKHDEAVVVNKFGNVITPTVDVKAWNDGGKKKIKF